MSAIDHKAEAEKIAVEIVTGGTKRDEYLAEAQLHATLYAAEQTAELVNQQRVANLQREREVARRNYERTGHTSSLAAIDFDVLDARIREGLGLS